MVSKRKNSFMIRDILHSNPSVSENGSDAAHNATDRIVLNNDRIVLKNDYNIPSQTNGPCAHKSCDRTYHREYSSTYDKGVNASEYSHETCECLQRLNGLKFAQTQREGVEEVYSSALAVKSALRNSFRSPSPKLQAPQGPLLPSVLKSWAAAAAEVNARNHLIYSRNPLLSSTTNNAASREALPNQGINNSFLPNVYPHSSRLYHDVNNGSRSQFCDERNANSFPVAIPVPVYLRTRVTDTNNRPRRCRRSRTVFSELQLMGLEQRFGRQKYLSTPDRSELARSLGLSQVQVKTWYQNRRMKWKKQVLLQGATEPPTKSKGRPRKEVLRIITSTDPLPTGLDKSLDKSTVEQNSDIGEQTGQRKQKQIDRISEEPLLSSKNSPNAEH